MTVAILFLFSSTMITRMENNTVTSIVLNVMSQRIGYEFFCAGKGAEM